MDSVLTVDIEDWYQTRDFNFNPSDWSKYESRIEHSTDILLELLSRYNARATFFVLGCMAQRYPGLIRKIASLGHEIGSHGGWHRMVDTLSIDGFRDDLLYSKRVLEDITGSRIELFRAPTWSITSKTLWALEVLEEEGFICDSSIQPFITPFSGMKGVPVSPFHPVLRGKRLNIVEYPACVLKVGRWRLPFSGGFYMRFFPLPFISWALSKANEEGRGMVYIHPWELDTGQPRIKAPIHAKILHYYNLDSTVKKLDNLLRYFKFQTLGKAIAGMDYPSIAIFEKSMQQPDYFL